MEFKTCAECLETKDITRFRLDKGKRRNRCNDCLNKANAHKNTKWQAEQRARIEANEFNQMMKYFNGQRE